MPPARFLHRASDARRTRGDEGVGVGRLVGCWVGSAEGREGERERGREGERAKRGVRGCR
eukprot:847774-Rhodomonas_salina.1